MTTGLLGDTRAKSYAHKLRLFNAFAAPELRDLIASLNLRPGARVLDAGCGLGQASLWLQEASGPMGFVAGFDLADEHASLARAARANVVLADVMHPPFGQASFDLIWTSNTINHLRKPDAGLCALAALLRPNGRIAIGQSAFMPEMFFAWDARLENAVTLACRQYYRDKYGLDERDLTRARNVIGVAQRAGLQIQRVQSIVIERTAPLSALDVAYFVECVFNSYWGQRVQPYLQDADWRELQALCDPSSPAYCLRRADFHHLQTYTLVVISL